MLSESVTGQSVPCNMPLEINNLLVIVLPRLTPYRQIIVIHASLTIDLYVGEIRQNVPSLSGPLGVMLRDIYNEKCSTHAGRQLYIYEQQKTRLKFRLLDY
ncbi:hypothetical protein MKW98_013785 [Papaver atlanticum]|uniref:Uncharacterized protein n=1 Tax=Papaver atlanticum TaxID=357466 RepID=A0AAD4XVU1_9MAGN|nr:hypothetical protein MKW98_013785 [Papaver atlanticum]